MIKPMTPKTVSARCGLYQIVFIGCMAVFTPGASADVCTDLNVAIDRNIFDMALSMGEGDLNDKSAVQQGTRATRDSNRLSIIMLNLQLQFQNKCQPRQRPIDPSIYLKQAKACSLAQTELIFAGATNDPEKRIAAFAKSTSACDFNSWHQPVTK